MTTYIKRPRLYVDCPLHDGATVTLDEGQAHYLRAVLRAAAGEEIRVFNGQDGEYLCVLDTIGKKTATATAQQCLRPQTAPDAPLHLYFAPIKKARLDILIEKAVELGVTHLHPVITQNTENRNWNPDRTHAQIIEAAEQCERLDIPALAAPVTLAALCQSYDADAPLYACIERAEDAPHLAALCKSGPAALLIGPEGGFTAAEIAQIRALPAAAPVSLGPRILRAETAALAALITAQNSRV